VMAGILLGREPVDERVARERTRRRRVREAWLAQREARSTQ